MGIECDIWPIAPEGKLDPIVEQWLYHNFESIRHCLLDSNIIANPLPYEPPYVKPLPLCPIPAPIDGFWTFYGKVFIDPNSDGIQDAGEVGVAGVTIRVSSDDFERVVTTLTNSEGCYAISWAFAPYDWQPVVSMVRPVGYVNSIPLFGYYDASGMTLGTVRNYNFGIKLPPPPPPPSLAGAYVTLSDGNVNNNVTMSWVVTNSTTHEGYASGAGVAAGYSLTRKVGTFNGVPGVLYWELVAGSGMRLRYCYIRLHNTNMLPTGAVIVEPGNPQAPTEIFYSLDYFVLTFGSSPNDFAKLFQSTSPPLKFTLSVVG